MKQLTKGGVYTLNTIAFWHTATQCLWWRVVPVHRSALGCTISCRQTFAFPLTALLHSPVCPRKFKSIQSNHRVQCQFVQPASVKQSCTPCTPDAAGSALWAHRSYLAVNARFLSCSFTCMCFCTWESNWPHLLVLRAPLQLYRTHTHIISIARSDLLWQEYYCFNSSFWCPYLGSDMVSLHRKAYDWKSRAALPVCPSWATGPHLHLKLSRNYTTPPQS